MTRYPWRPIHLRYYKRGMRREGDTMAPHMRRRIHGALYEEEDTWGMRCCIKATHCVCGWLFCPKKKWKERERETFY